MRRHGSIARWVDERGFGFISDDENGEEVVLHVSSLSRRSIRPQVGDRVSFDLQLDDRGRPQAVRVAHARGPVFAQVVPASAERSRRRKPPGATVWIAGVVALALGFGWFMTRPVPAPAPTPSAAGILPRSAAPGRAESPSANPSPVLRATAGAPFSCQGKTRCSEMTSCAEAVFYMQRCSGSVTDGDGDGLPCEDQWCGH